MGYSFRNQKTIDANNHYSAFLKLVPHPVTLIRVKGNQVVAVNPAFEKLSGYSRSEIVFRNIEELEFWSSPASWDNLFHAVTTNRVINRMPLKIKCKNCLFISIYLSLRFVDFRGESYYLMTFHETDQASKKPISMLKKNSATLAREIVERRQAEDALHESERRFREVVNNFPGLLFQLQIHTDGSNHFNFISPKAVDFFGNTSETELEKIDLNSRIHPDDRCMVLTSLERSINEKSNWLFEARILTPKQGIRWFQGISTPVLVNDEIVFNGLILDITERKKEEESLKASLSKYKMLFESYQHADALIDEVGIIWEATEKPERIQRIKKSKKLTGPQTGKK